MTVSLVYHVVIYILYVVFLAWHVSCLCITQLRGAVCAEYPGYGKEAQWSDAESTILWLMITLWRLGSANPEILPWQM